LPNSGSAFLFHTMHSASQTPLTKDWFHLWCRAWLIWLPYRNRCSRV